jgi:hypothetical protein
MCNDNNMGNNGNQQRPGNRQLFGKYRGTVIESIDPLLMGRILAEVPAVQAGVLNWALPCSPYAGPEIGWYAPPPPGANVWIEFEGGDPTYPIWSGCFWEEGEVPAEALANPFGVTIVAPEMILLFAGADISATAVGLVTLEAGVDVSASAAGAVTLEAGADISISAAGIVDVQAVGDVSISAVGAVTAEAVGDVSISAAGAATMEAVGDISLVAVADVNLTSVTVAITGITEVTGDLLVDGQQVLFI